MQLVAGGFFIFVECVSVDVQRCRDGARARGDLRLSQRPCRLQSASLRSYDGANVHSGYTADRFS